MAFHYKKIRRMGQTDRQTEDRVQHLMPPMEGCIINCHIWISTAVILCLKALSLLHFFTCDHSFSQHQGNYKQSVHESIKYYFKKQR